MPVVLASRMVVPQEHVLSRDDRCLGVAVKWVALRQGERVCVISAADPQLADGFQAFEPPGGMRWTDGEGVLPPTLFDGFSGLLELFVHVACTARYPLTA